MERMCQYLRYLNPLQIWVLLSALFLTSREHSASTMEEKMNEMFEQVAKLPLLTQTVRKLRPNDFPDSSLAARVTTLETNATSVSSGSGLERSWNMLGHSDGSTAIGSLGSHAGSSDDNGNTRRRLDTLSSPEDEQSRSAVLLRFPCEQYHKGITKRIHNLREESNMPAYKKPVRIHCTAGSVSVWLVFETRTKCQDFTARYKDDGIPYAINSHLCCTNQISLSANPNQLKTERLEKQFAPLWRELADQLNVLFPDGDDEGAFIIPALDARSHVLSVKDRRNGVGKLVFKLASLCSGQAFTLVTLELPVPGVSPEVLQRVLSRASTATM